jgi:hypothetical protein
METLLTLAQPTPVRSLRGSARRRDLRWARMCYDHLAGVAGVAVTEALTTVGAIAVTDGAWVLGPQGAPLFGGLGLDAPAVPHRTRPLLRPCLDWTERRHHLAGGLGAALAAELTRRGWIRRLDGSRIVAVTPAGQAGLQSWLSLDLGQLRAVAAA